MYGNLPPRALPVQDPELIMILAQRWARASTAHEKWALIATKCMDFVEGRQWTQDQLKAMAKQKRPALTLNKVNRLLRLVQGYFDNNKTTIDYLPGQDGSGSVETAEILNKVSQQIDEMNDMQFVDTEVAMDGLITGRGYYDARLDFTENDFGDIRETSKDPFTIYLDPEGDQYDLNKSSFVIEKRIVNLDEIEWTYGRDAKNILYSYAGSNAPSLSGLVDLYARSEVAPMKGFGSLDHMDRWQSELSSIYGEMVDPFRKDITVLDMQYWVRSMSRVFIDLTTGDRAIIPNDMSDDEIAKVMYYAEMKGAPVTVQWRPIKKPRWTTLAGPLMVYDKEVPYQTFSLNAYFPYFRRGQTRGMVEDLLDPQMEVNKRRSATIEILSKTANGGWMIHKDALTQQQRANWRKNSSTPGFIGEWKGDQAYHKPEQITPQVNTQRLQALEEKADQDFSEISGINESAMGDIDKVQSGRAVEARQRQAIIAIQPYLTNRNRTVQLRGEKRLNLIQKHYTEHRVMRIINDNSKPDIFEINKRIMDPMGGAKRLNDVTIGKYTVAIDETPASQTFLAAQFDEALMLLEKMGPVGAKMLELRPDLLVQMSSLPRKEEWIGALQQAITATLGALPGQLPPDGGGGLGGGMPVQPGAPATNAPSIDQGVAGPGAEIIPMNPAKKTTP